MSDPINANFEKPVVMRSGEMPWQASPSPTVWRKRLDLAGPSETSRVTSVVRYDPGSTFASHPHPDGEEILVLEGVFSDEHGDYPAGGYLLNPEGFSHAPFSKEGCVIFVKLRQFPGLGRDHVYIDTNTAEWDSDSSGQAEKMGLFKDDRSHEEISLVRLAAGAQLPPISNPGGEEIFVLDGALRNGGDPVSYDGGCWLRFPPGGRHELHAPSGARVYRKVGHLTHLITP